MLVAYFSIWGHMAMALRTLPIILEIVILSNSELGNSYSENRGQLKESGKD